MKKDLYAIAYVITSLLILGVIFHYHLKFQQEAVATFEQKNRLTQLYVRQEVLSQQISKTAMGMGDALGTSIPEENFLAFQRQLTRILPLWQEINTKLTKDDTDLGFSELLDTDTYLSLQKELRNHYTLLNNDAFDLTILAFSDDPQDINYQSMRTLIRNVTREEGDYLSKAKNITDYFYTTSQNRRSSLSTGEKMAIGILGALFFIQEAAIFRPLWRMSNENYKTANKAFFKVKKSEEKLRISYEKQRKINKKLLISRHQMVGNLKRLKESEGKLLKSTYDQIKINDELILAQNNLKGAYARLQASDEEIRILAEKQLEDNEKLFFADTKLFMNILNNAIQAIPDERTDGELVIYTEETTDGITIRIKDNGVGIPEDIRDRIYNYST